MWLENFLDWFLETVTPMVKALDASVLQMGVRGDDDPTSGAFWTAGAKKTKRSSRVPGSHTTPAMNAIGMKNHREFAPSRASWCGTESARSSGSTFLAKQASPWLTHLAGPNVNPDQAWRQNKSPGTVLRIDAPSSEHRASMQTHQHHQHEGHSSYGPFSSSDGLARLSAAAPGQLGPPGARISELQKQQVLWQHFQALQPHQWNQRCRMPFRTAQYHPHFPSARMSPQRASFPANYSALSPASYMGWPQLPAPFPPAPTPYQQHNYGSMGNFQQRLWNSTHAPNFKRSDATWTGHTWLESQELPSTPLTAMDPPGHTILASPVPRMTPDPQSTLRR